MLPEAQCLMTSTGCLLGHRAVVLVISSRTSAIACLCVGSSEACWCDPAMSASLLQLPAHVHH